VANHREARDGAFVEILGHYYPRTTPERLELDRERVAYWLSKGARPSDTVRTLLARHVPAPVAAAAAATE
jgi:small subunit ribosomal protein S16